MLALERCVIYIVKMTLNLRMTVKAVDDIEFFRKLRCVFGQIVSRAAAYKQNINISFKAQYAVCRVNLNSALRIYLRFFAACKNADGFHVLRRKDRSKRTAPQIAVAENCCSYHNKKTSV